MEWTLTGLPCPMHAAGPQLAHAHTLTPDSRQAWRPDRSSRAGPGSVTVRRLRTHIPAQMSAGGRTEGSTDITLHLDLEAEGLMPAPPQPSCMTSGPLLPAALGLLLRQMRGWAGCSLTSLPTLTFWESMNVIKFMNRLLCLEQVSLKYMQIALSIAVPWLRRQPGIFT